LDCYVSLYLENIFINAFNLRVFPLKTSSGIIFITAGAPSPYFAVYNPPPDMSIAAFKSDNTRTSGKCCFAVELGVGNAHWPSSYERNLEFFDVAPNLGAKFLFGMDDSVPFVSPYSSTSSITISPQGKISIKIFNTSALSYKPSSADGNLPVSEGIASLSSAEAPVLAFECNLDILKN